jgi:hypothetical protein
MISKISGAAGTAEAVPEKQTCIKNKNRTRQNIRLCIITIL